METAAGGGRLGRLRVRRAEREAARLRGVLGSLDRAWDADEHRGQPERSHARRSVAGSLIAVWTLCAVSVVATVAWRGPVSGYGAAADLAFLAVSTALFLTYMFTGETGVPDAPEGPGNESETQARRGGLEVERRSGSDRRLSDTGAWFGLERRSGVDRRAVPVREG